MFQEILSPRAQGLSFNGLFTTFDGLLSESGIAKGQGGQECEEAPYAAAIFSS